MLEVQSEEKRETGRDSGKESERATIREIVQVKCEGFPLCMAPIYYCRGVHTLFYHLSSRCGVLSYRLPAI